MHKEEDNNNQSGRTSQRNTKSAATRHLRQRACGEEHPEDFKPYYLIYHQPLAPPIGQCEHYIPRDEPAPVDGRLLPAFDLVRLGAGARFCRKPGRYCGTTSNSSASQSLSRAWASTASMSA